MTKCGISNSHNNSTACLLLLILMLWQRQAIFESKGAKLSSSDEWIRSRKVWSETTIHIVVSGLIHQVTSKLNAHWQTDWAIEDQAKKLELNSLWCVSIQPTCLYCRLAFAPGFGDIHVCCCQFWCSDSVNRLTLSVYILCFDKYESFYI